ncbi:MAG: sulfate adenylyltransferase, partial [Chitinophagaceae bacterium]
PGHIQYTRNMVTGASTANLAIILIDARKGLLEQTFRHTFIAALLRIPHLVVCINKMDLVGYDETVYNRIVEAYKGFASKLEITDLHFIPISALDGDNIVDHSVNMPWYNGTTLLYLLENVHIASDLNRLDGRFPVQLVIRPQTKEHQDYRGYAGRVQGGIFKPGDEVKVLPSGFTTYVKTIEMDSELLSEAFCPMSVTMTLKDDLDISRGDMIVRQNNEPTSEQDIDVTICWMNQKPLQEGAMLLLRHTTKECKVLVKKIVYQIDINTLNRKDVFALQMNDMARLTLRTSQPLFFDSYRKNRQTGSLILIDEGTNETVAAGMIS